MKKRLSKALAAAGVASRRACEEIIATGRVQVNGEVILIPQTLVDWSHDTITLDGEKIGGEETKVYYLLHKPIGYLCSTTGNGKKVLDLFSHLSYRLFTVGRLDRDTSGLILITNDGAFANQVIHPSYNVTKEYLAKVSQEITDIHLKALSAGTTVDGIFVKPVSVKKVRRGTLKIVVSEGKNHEVRHLIDHARLTLRELSRIRIGPLTLGNLSLGAHRPLFPEEIEQFQ